MNYIPVTDLLFPNDRMDRLRIVASRAFRSRSWLVYVADYEDLTPIASTAR